MKELFFREENMAVTLDSLKKSIGKKKKSRLFVWVADLEREAGNLDSALKILDEGLKEFPDMAHAHLIRSVVFMAQGNFESALEACDAILKVNPTCLSALRRKGDIYAELGDEMARNKYYRLVHDIDPLDMFWKDEYSVMPEEEQALPELSDEPLLLPEESSEDILLPQEESEEDPFQMLSALMPEEGNEEDALSDALENSLNDALEKESFFEKDSEASAEPIEEAVSGSDVSSAISDFFGAEEDLFEEAKPASPFSNIEIPVSLEDPEPEVQESAPSPFEMSAFEKSAESVPAEESSVGLETAFDSLLGEDELPEESSSFEKSAEAVSAEESSVGSETAFDSLLGEDELPEEQSSFEKSAESVPAEESSVGLETAFDSLLGEDELPEEPSAFEKSAESVPAEESSVGLETAFDSLLGEDELPEESSSFEKSAESVPAEESSVGLETAFDSLLGEDELPEEPSSFEKSAESVPAEESSVGLETEPNNDMAAFAVPAPALDLDEEPAESLSDLLGTSVEKDETGISSAFDSLFGEEDELLDDASLKAFAKKEQEEKAVESSPLMELDEDELSLPAANEVKSDPLFTTTEERTIPSELSAEVSSSLDALFGDDDDDLELPTMKQTSSQESLGTVSHDESEEMTGAFKTLFNSDDDLLEEKVEGQDKVDVLMSGDSDDEVAAALLKDPMASLLENGENIDERLNTATLAEIYFEQGLYQKSLEIYQDLHEKNPEDEQIQKRLSEIQEAFDEKFGNREK
jgi:tetratricopeptide (TPR) repeat protein